jgi:hypothetical protein
VVGKLVACKIAGGAGINLRPHSRIPFVPLGHNAVIYIAMALLEVGTLQASAIVPRPALRSSVRRVTSFGISIFASLFIL